MRGAIFDLDGTLADTADDLLAAANRVLGPRGLPRLDPATDRPVAGRGGRQMIRRSLELAGMAPDDAEGVALTDALYPDLLVAYEGAIAVHTRLFPGAAAALDRIEAAGWRLGVCTNKPERLAHLVLAALGLGARFGAVLGSDTLSVRKPDPEHFRETARRIGADPARSVMIGDTITDADTARAAGAPCVLVSFGFADRPLAAIGADRVIDGFDDLDAALADLMP